jgi:hypothetical protein
MSKISLLENPRLLSPSRSIEGVFDGQNFGSNSSLFSVLSASMRDSNFRKMLVCSLTALPGRPYESSRKERGVRIESGAAA